MRRRKWTEICVGDQLPPTLPADYQEFDYSLLIPSYVHKSMVYDCNASDNSTNTVDDVTQDDVTAASPYTQENTTAIVPNAIYDHAWTAESNQYHRDNYCLIPYKVPPMMLSGTTYNLADATLYSKVPDISTIYDLKYDTTIWTQDKPIQFSDIVVSSYADFSDILNTGICACSDKTGSFELDKDLYDYKNHPDKYQCGPLDTVVVDYFDIADNYQLGWSAMWDMGSVNNNYKYGTGGGGYRPKDSSSSVVAVNGSLVYLCVIKATGPGSSGATTVTGVRVGGNGDVYETGPSFVVNLPTI